MTKMINSPAREFSCYPQMELRTNQPAHIRAQICGTIVQHL
ncbi:hypothetical protein ACFL3F_05265 [Planctomycetota bacterium]